MEVSPPSQLVGKSFTGNNCKVHFFRTGMKITDLTNAGKRGKTCQEIYIALRWDRDPDLVDKWFTFCEIAADMQHFDKLALMAAKFKTVYPDDFVTQSRELRGIDVPPAKFSKLEIRGDYIYVEADYDDFVVRDLTDTANEQTCIPAIKGGKRFIPIFYKMVLENEAAIRNMKFSQFYQLLDRYGIKFHQFCAMD